MMMKQDGIPFGALVIFGAALLAILFAELPVTTREVVGLAVAIAAVVTAAAVAIVIWRRH
jgi:hypothetical protein